MFYMWFNIFFLVRSPHGNSISIRRFYQSRCCCSILGGVKFYQNQLCLVRISWVLILVKMLIIACWSCIAASSQSIPIPRISVTYKGGYCYICCSCDVVTVYSLKGQPLSLPPLFHVFITSNPSSVQNIHHSLPVSTRTLWQWNSRFHFSYYTQIRVAFHPDCDCRSYRLCT